MQDWEKQGVQAEICIIGSKGASFFRPYGMDISATVSGLGEEPEISQLIGSIKDRKSTRLNSSHVRISYAVFCLKKKKKKKTTKNNKKKKKNKKKTKKQRKTAQNR